MTSILKNSKLEVTIGDPMELYQGARFDHTGNIIQVVLNGKHSFCSFEQTEHDPKLGFGLLNEFKIDESLNYNKALVGEQFIKIGVGNLTKEENINYQFMRQYKMELPNIKIDKRGTEEIEYSYNTEAVNGFKLSYRKNIRLINNTLIVKYFLKNDGTMALPVSEYCHNFVSINNQLIDQNYSLELSFDIKPDEFEKMIDTDDVIDLHKSQISWKRSVLEEFYIKRLSGKEKLPSWWILTNKREGLGIKEEVDFNCSSVDVWGKSHVVCPEMFYNVTINPGEEKYWERKFTFFETN